jgi:hypothetical protein
MHVGLLLGEQWRHEPLAVVQRVHVHVRVCSQATATLMKAIQHLNLTEESVAEFDRIFGRL